MQLTDASQMVELEKDPHAAFALIIDGKMLSYVLEPDMKHQFLHLAVQCASVICCRVSPKQKALVKYFIRLYNCYLKFLFQIIDFLTGYYCFHIICILLLPGLPGNKISKRRNWKDHISHW